MSGSPRHLERIGLVLLAGVVLVIGLASIRSWDVWWHLKTGELALERLSTLPVDEFSLTRAGAPWTYKDLGADVLLYLLYTAAGPLGLALLKVFVALFVFILLLTLAHRRVEEVWLAYLVAGIAFLVASFRIIVRPEAFSLLLLPVTLLAVDRWRSPPDPQQDNRADTPLFGRTAVGLVVVFVLWSNLHRGFVVGLAVLWSQAVYEVLAVADSRLARGRPRLFRNAGSVDSGTARRALAALCMAAAATAASLLNPFGTRPLVMAFEVTSSESLAQMVSEWQVLSLAELWTHFPLAAIWIGITVISVAAAGVLAFRRGGRPDIWDMLMTALFIGIGLSAVRMLPVMAIGTAGPLASALSVLMGDRHRATIRRIPGFAAIVALAVCLIGWVNSSIVPSPPGFASDWYPESAADLIRTAPVRGEGFTTFTFAGYVTFHLWPDKHVICDGRFDTVYDDATMARCLGAERDRELWEHMQLTYQLEWVLTHNRSPSLADSGWPGSFHFLDADPEWSLVHWDSTSLLYVRTRGPNRSLAGEMGYVLLRPHDPDVSLFEALQRTAQDSLARARLEDELRRLQLDAPNDYRTHILSALYLFETGAAETEEFRLVIDTLELERDRNPVAIDQVLEWVGAVER